MASTLAVNEIYLSLQGESTFAGLPCIFIRLKGCPLRCSYCDTAYAFFDGQSMTLEAVTERIDKLTEPFQSLSLSTKLPLIEFTGGEPLAQKALPTLMKQLCEQGRTVLLETSGALDISPTPIQSHRIMDLKCPSSGESDRMLWSNLEHLTHRDEIKFVVATWEDYRWMKECIEHYQLAQRCPLLCSWAAPLQPSQRHPSLKPGPTESDRLTLRELAEAIVRDALPVRFQLQMHKFIWNPEERGV